MVTKRREPHFTPRFFHFFRELAANNERAWFEENRARYEADVRQPLLGFIADFAPYLRKVSARFVADPRPVGGSMLRIHRDVRFAKDKSPYKCHAAVQFRHEVGKDIHAPGFYLHLEPGKVFAGSGLWHPEPEVLAKIRAALTEKPAAWKKVVGDPAFQAAGALHGEVMKRPPRGTDPDHPLIEDLKRKDFIFVSELREKDAISPDFAEKYFEVINTAKPFMRFLSKAVGLSF